MSPTSSPSRFDVGATPTSTTAHRMCPTPVLHHLSVTVHNPPLTHHLHSYLNQTVQIHTSHTIVEGFHIQTHIVLCCLFPLRIVPLGISSAFAMIPFLSVPSFPRRFSFNYFVCILNLHNLWCWFIDIPQRGCWFSFSLLILVFSFNYLCFYPKFTWLNYGVGSLTHPNEVACFPFPSHVHCC